MESTEDLFYEWQSNIFIIQQLELYRTELQELFEKKTSPPMKKLLAADLDNLVAFHENLMDKKAQIQGLHNKNQQIEKEIVGRMLSVGARHIKIFHKPRNGWFELYAGKKGKVTITYSQFKSKKT